MILIADSGSTKTDWRLIDDQQKIHQYATQGLNPYFLTSEEISLILQNELLPQLKSQISNLKSQIYFYGAGCASSSKKEIIRNALFENFPSAEIHIETDILGAARSLCGHSAGIIAILGTGANTCYYDGKNIMENLPSLGYALGDEGSGAHLGKTFIQAYLNKEIPTELSERFFQKYKLGKEEVLDAVYKQPMPNRFLASFSKYLYQNLKEQFIIDLVVKCFNEFFDKHICKYANHKNIPLHCTGSVAFYYSNILRSVAENKGINIGTITETPIAGLTLYHLGE